MTSSVQNIFMITLNYIFKFSNFMMKRSRFYFIVSLKFSNTQIGTDEVFYFFFK